MFEQVSFDKLRQIHSQNYDEDLILSEIIRKLKITTGNAVELMGGDGIECNISRLALIGWNCIIYDGNQNKIQKGTNFWSDFPSNFRPTLINAWITRENVYDLIKTHLPGALIDIDVLSLDMDGMDYWVLKTLYEAGLRPKVLILEIQEMWTDQECLTLEYNPNFYTNRPEESGCSLLSFMKLLENDYKLIACISKGFNVFLVRKDLDPDSTLFQAMNPKECFKHHHGHFENIMKWRRENVKQNMGVGKWVNPNDRATE